MVKWALGNFTVNMVDRQSFELLLSSKTPSKLHQPTRIDAELAMNHRSLLPGLPDDLGLLCLARVPRVFHSSLCKVCKSWRSLIHSPIFLYTRTRLNITQQFLYMMLRFPGRRSRWFVLSEYQSLKKVSPLPHMPCSPPIGAVCTVLDTKLFVLGGSENGTPSPDVWVFDACFSKWEEGPKMGVARESAAVGVINGKIYVVGGCKIDTQAPTNSWAEVFDPCLGSWAPAPTPNNVTEITMYTNVVIEDKLFCVTDSESFFYDPKASSWFTALPELGSHLTDVAAVVDGILYCYDSSFQIMGYDLSENRWMELQGLEKESSRHLPNVKFCNVGEKLYILWEDVGRRKEFRLSCAALEVYKESSGVLRGSVIWSDFIYGAIPRGTNVLHLLSLEL